MPIKRNKESYKDIRARLREPDRLPVEQNLVAADKAPKSTIAVDGDLEPTRTDLAIKEKTPTASSRNPKRNTTDKEPTPATDSAQTAPKATENLRLKFRIAHPAPGESIEYDQIAKIYDREMAMKVLWGRAFEAWMENANPKRIVSVDISYRTAENVSQYNSTRMVESQVFEGYVKLLDPLRIRTQYSICQMIGKRVLAKYISESNIKASDQGM